MSLLIVHRRSKDQSFIRRLVESLEKQIGAGVHTGEATIERLRDSDAVIVLCAGGTFAPRAIGQPGDGVRRAIGLALEIGKLLLVACLDGATLPEALPPDIRALANLARVNVQTDEDGVQSIVNAVERLAPFARRTPSLIDGLPTSVSLLRLLSLVEGRPIDSLDRLPIAENWQASRDAARAAWPRAPIGVLAGGKVRELVFAADQDGVHGMIAGTTGAGKSEFLMSLILALAVYYDPSVVNFVLVDYQGGATFEPFRALPHCIDVVTSRQGMTGMRTFLALRAELMRRARIISEARVKNIVQYRARNYHVTREPLPHLFVVIDEFAEMFREMPDAGKQLDSIARLGRALGVHLILATQRPSGVVSEQVRANMGFRICMRVQANDDSYALIRTPDAAALSARAPGRAYVMSSGDELQLMQAAYSSAAYPTPESAEAPLFEALLNEFALHYEGRKPQRKPWPDPLPLRFALDTEALPGEVEPNANLPLSMPLRTLQAGYRAWPGIDWANGPLVAHVGLYDNPLRAEQGTLRLDLTEGHALILGGPGDGKTMLLRTLMMSLAASHSPDQLHAYILDFGERGLRILRDLPQVGAYITVSEGERIRRLFHRLLRLSDERKLLLSDAQVDDIYAYNALNPDDIIPPVVVLIDNFVELKEIFADTENVMTAVAQLMRSGRALGIHFVLTVGTASDIPSKLYRLFSETNTLFLGNTIFTEYVPGFSRASRAWHKPREAMEYHETDITLIPGRGFAYIDGVPLEFHAALPVEAAAEDTRPLTVLVEAMRDLWPEEYPGGIDILPSKIYLKHLLPETVVENIPTIIGLSDTDLELATLNLRHEAPHFAIVGPVFSGKTTLLRALVMSLCHSNPPEKIALVLVDLRGRLYRYGGEHSLAELPHVLETVTDLEDLREMIANLKAEYQGLQYTDDPRRDIFVLIDNYDDLGSALGTGQGNLRGLNALAELAELARRYGVDGLHFVIAGPLAGVRSSDDLVRHVLASRYGLSLDPDDALQALGGRMRTPNRYSASFSSYYETGAKLPPGRGFIVRAGNVSLVQVASPHEYDDPHGSLDNWISEIIARNPQRARWRHDVAR